MKKLMAGAAAPFVLAMLLAGCSGGEDAVNNTAAAAEAGAEAEDDHGGNEAAHEEGEGEEGAITLTAQQIKAAGIEVVRVSSSGGGALTLPATIEGDPQGTQVVSAAIGGRIVALNRNLGEPVARGQVVAVIESREAASLRAEVEAALARSALAQSNLRREERLFKLRVSPERDLIAARTAATEANIAQRLAQQQVSAAGVSAGSLNRIGVVAPIGGRITARPVVLGQTVAADAELFRVSNLARVAVTVSLSPADAARVRVGTPVEISAGGRRSAAPLSFVSPVLDETTRLVTAIALIDNSAGQWRVGEPVSAILYLPGEDGGAVSVPAAAVQTVENRNTVFVRTPTGFRAQAVTLGARGAGTVAVTSGLTGREEVASNGSFTLKAELAKGEAEHGGH
ncbi:MULTISPECIES: efflux RND transporter periplasmic adaptor subunit [unclassified Sphingomonas]|jgi:cobalt-zinc-cadmium efflux system membrane fusion protein|uniref:efflux RND transporter periplasmic adaptor subunit n=1 Tax=unclassified Sphingomonas TaxID=196159 RepID=UPI000835FBC3|nr:MULTISPECIES: efflux RND transporter periplasmic adaptor subunit [unclassified Sphingomonas]MBA4763008.1 efflux RND transporter periplasmic adaptor subunit [Sphingomonas sp.]